MASSDGSELFPLVMRLAAGAAEPFADFMPPPNGNCQANCTKLAKDVGSEFFVFRAAQGKPAEDSPFGTITPVHAMQFPALISQSSSYTILDIKRCGLSPPHVHPRGVELQYVISGTMLLGFVDTATKYRFNVLKAGDIGVVPQGVVHFTMAITPEGFKSVAAFNSEEAGTLFVHSAMLDLPDAVIRATMNIKQSVVDHLRKRQGAVNMRPTVDPVCLKATENGGTFTGFNDGANMVAGGMPAYG